MTATLDSAAADLRRANAELQQTLDEYRAERDEALAREAALAEVLQIINASPGNLEPVFAVMLEKAMHLCEAAFGLLTTYDGEAFRTAAHRGLPPRFAEYAETVKDWAGAHRQLSAGADLVHLRDARDDGAYRTLPSRRALVDLGGARTVLLVALRKDDELLGSFAIYRQEVRPFTDRQIALLQNFAAQAVIAMENAGLLTETRKALEQQTATAEVLQVINSSPGDLAPVFDTLLEKAMRLCEASFGEFIVAEGERVRAVAVRGAPAAFAEIRRRSAPPTPGTSWHASSQANRSSILPMRKMTIFTDAVIPIGWRWLTLPGLAQLSR
jgi:hypothetical protein